MRKIQVFTCLFLFMIFTMLFTPRAFSIDTTPPTITNVCQIPPKTSVSSGQKVNVNATVTDLSGVKQVTLIYAYSNTTGTYLKVLSMTNIHDDIWNGTIPGMPYRTNVTYTIMAEDTIGNIITTQEMGYQYQYQVIPEFASLLPFGILTIAIIPAIIYKRKHSAKID